MLSEVIHKYAVPDTPGVHFVEMPCAAAILSCAYQGATLVLWARHRVEGCGHAAEQRKIAVAITGRQFPSDWTFERFIGTAQVPPGHGGPYVVHLFELRERAG